MMPAVRPRQAVSLPRSTPGEAVARADQSIVGACEQPPTGTELPSAGPVDGRAPAGDLPATGARGEVTQSTGARGEATQSTGARGDVTRKASKDTLEQWDQHTSIAGHIGQTLSQLPGAVMRFVPGLLNFALIDAIVPIFQVAAAVGGVVAFVGVGASGAIELASGLRHREPAKILGGAGDLSRGAFLATVAHDAWKHGAITPGVHGALGHGLMYASGAFAIASGAVKMHQAEKGSRERVAGALEVGIGICSLAATQGALMLPAIAVQAALAVTRVVVTQREALQAAARVTVARARTSWNHLRALFGGAKKPAVAATDQKPASAVEGSTQAPAIERLTP